jgi:hypothetical protein
MNILLNESLLATKHISHAAIVRRKDGYVKTRSPNFVVGAYFLKPFFVMTQPASL